MLIHEAHALVEEATFQAWKAFARHTPRRFVNGREETAEEAHRRRFAALPEHTVEQFRAEALAVLSLVDISHAA